MATSSSASLIQVDPSGYQIGFYVCGTCSTYVALNQNCVRSFTPAGREAIRFDEIVNVEVGSVILVHDNIRVPYYEETTCFYDVRCKVCKKHLGWKVAEENVLGAPQITDPGKFVLKRYIISDTPSIKLIIEGKEENGNIDALEHVKDKDKGNGPSDTPKDVGGKGNGPSDTPKDVGGKGNGPSDTLLDVKGKGKGVA